MRGAHPAAGGTAAAVAVPFIAGAHGMHRAAPRPQLSVLPLLGRARLGVRFYFPPLLFDDVPQLAFHRLECVMDHFGQRLVCAVVLLLFVRDELVPARNRHVNAHAELISFLMGMVRLFDRDVAPIDVIAKFLKTGGVFENEIVNFI